MFQLPQRICKHWCTVRRCKCSIVENLPDHIFAIKNIFTIDYSDFDISSCTKNLYYIGARHSNWIEPSFGKSVWISVMDELSASSSGKSWLRTESVIEFSPQRHYTEHVLSLGRRSWRDRVAHAETLVSRLDGFIRIWDILNFLMPMYHYSQTLGVIIPRPTPSQSNA